RRGASRSSRDRCERSRDLFCEPLLIVLLLRGRLACGSLLRGGLGLRLLRGRLRLLLLRAAGGATRGADRLDLDLGQLRAEARVALVARALLVLADPDLVAESGADDLRRHLDARRQVRLPVTAREEDVRMERLPFGGRQPVDEQPVALADAVLLATE